MTKAAIYLRSASARGQDVTQTGQHAPAEAVAAARGWIVVNVFSDAGYPATSGDRPGLTSRFTAARSGASDAPIVADLQRFARKPEALAENLQNTGQAGVEVVVLSGPVHGPVAATPDRAGFAPGSGTHAAVLGHRRSRPTLKARRASA